MQLEKLVLLMLLLNICLSQEQHQYLLVKWNTTLFAPLQNCSDETKMLISMVDSNHSKRGIGELTLNLAHAPAASIRRI